jgi:hypothetical protein
MKQKQIKNVCRLLKIARAKLSELKQCAGAETPAAFAADHKKACSAAEIINNCLERVETVCAVPAYRAQLAKEIDRLFICESEYITIYAQKYNTL